VLDVLSQLEFRLLMTQTAVSIQRVNAYHGALQVLQDIELDIKSGQWTSIIGPNGAGKSTLLKVMACITTFSGEVVFPKLASKNFTEKVKARHVAWMGQNQMGADDLSVHDVAMLGRIPHQGLLGSPTAEDRRAVEEALKLTHVWDWRARNLKTLSGGERQRALLARALAVEADILLMDEPLANLDPPHQTDWLQIVKALISKGKTVVSVLHEQSIALMSDEIIVLNCGQIYHQGASSDPSTHRAIENVFENRIRVEQLDGRWISLPKMISDT